MSPRVNENTNNQRVLFSCFGKMLNTSAAKKLPTHDCPRNLANMFADYFDSKVRCIRASFPTTTADPMNADQLYHGPELCEFSPTTPTELSSLIRSMAKKSCSLDPIPGSLMTDCFSVLLPVFVNMINLSFNDGLVPALYKEAVLDPVIKKDSLDHEVYQNYRPISNLRFVSKATEKIVALRITDHLEDNNLLETFQSAYKIYSTETALTRINDDLLKAIDDNACVILVLLDLSAAFDTVDHQILLTRLVTRILLTRVVSNTTLNSTINTSIDSFMDSTGENQVDEITNYKTNVLSYYKYNMSVAHININSIWNRIDEVKLLLNEGLLHILAISETKLNSTYNSSLLQHPHYRTLRRDRKKGGGGLLVYIKNSVSAYRRTKLEPSDMESICIDVKGHNNSRFIVSSMLQVSNYK